MLTQLFIHECRLIYRSRASFLNPIWFFVMAVVLFPLTIGVAQSELTKIATGVLWVAAALASLLSLDTLFQDDARDGSLDHYLLSPSPLFGIVWIKIMAHWCGTGMPLLVCAALLSVLLQLSPAHIGLLCRGLLPGTVLFSFLGAIGAAATLGVRHGGVLLSMLVLPLFMPVLIGGAGSVQAVDGFTVWLWLMAGMFFVVGLAPFAIVGLLRVGTDQC